VVGHAASLQRSDKGRGLEIKRGADADDAAYVFVGQQPEIEAECVWHLCDAGLVMMLLLLLILLTARSIPGTLSARMRFGY